MKVSEDARVRVYGEEWDARLVGVNQIKAHVNPGSSISDRWAKEANGERKEVYGKHRKGGKRKVVTDYQLSFHLP